jgi:predicted nucleotidyltransferase
MVSFPYEKEVEIYCRKIAGMLRPRSIVLFGSMARGNYGVGSDVDILVISDNFPSNFLERLRLLFDANPTFAPIQAVGYTPAEFLKMIQRRHPTALYAVAEGKPLLDDGFFEEAKQFLRG